ncbi:MAG: hypothetical protein ACO3UM_19825, partial [Planctomycetota bacterium]
MRPAFGRTRNPSTEDETMKKLSVATLSLFSLAAADVVSAQKSDAERPIAIEMEVVAGGHAGIAVTGLEGGAVIVICGLGGSDDDRPYEDLDPMDRLPEDVAVLGFLPAHGSAAQALPVRPEVLRQLRIGVFALGQDAAGQFRMSKMKTARQLAEDIEAAGLEIGEARRTGAAGLEGETDPHFGEGLQLEVERAGWQGEERALTVHLDAFESGLELVVDQVVFGGSADAPERVDMYLTLREQAPAGEFRTEVG